MKALALCTVLLVSASTALCCFAPKAEQISAVEDLVKRTGEIYLSEAVERGPEGFIHFKIVESVKGDQKNKFKVEGRLSDIDSTDFHRHIQAVFWSNTGGRSQIEPNCQIKPTFQLGKKYLIFLDKPYHLKSFELIENVESDTWLKKVRRLAKES